MDTKTRKLNNFLKSNDVKKIPSYVFTYMYIKNGFLFILGSWC